MDTVRTRKTMLLAAAIVAAWLWAGVGSPRGQPRLMWSGPKAESNPVAARAEGSRQAADRLFASRRAHEAGEAYRAMIERYVDARDPAVGEEVAKARFRLAATVAAKRDFEAARRAYRDVWLHYRGTSERDLRTGTTLVERAEFEEAVCTGALGEREQAAEAFSQFIDDHPTSGLIYAAARRAADLGGARAAHRAAEALDTAAVAYDRAQRESRREAALCGPKALAAVCRAHGVSSTVARLAGLAGTDKAGTTLAGLARAAHAQGLSAVGVQASPQSLARLPRPLIVLARGGHYLVLTRAAGGRAHLDDPSIPGRSVELAVADLPAITDGYALVVGRSKPEQLIAQVRDRGGAR